MKNHNYYNMIYCRLKVMLAFMRALIYNIDRSRKRGINMSKVKLTKMQKDILDAYYCEFGVSGCVSYYSINGYLMVALEVVKNTSPYTSDLERAIREYLLTKYNNEVYHYIDNYEEEIKGEVLL